MAGGKETPRQKMIGMMYLVLTALLALNVSKDILDAFTIVDNGLRTSNEVLVQKNGASIAALASNSNQEKAGPFLKKAKEVEAKTNELMTYIEELKARVYSASHTGNPEAPTFQDYIVDGKAVALDDYNPDGDKYITKPDENQNNTTLLIGPAPEDPIDANFSAVELKRKLQEFGQYLTSIGVTQFNGEPWELKDQVKTNITKTFEYPDTPADPEKDILEQRWETKNFYHAPLAAIIPTITKLQVDAENAKGDVLNALRAGVDGDSYKFTDLVPLVVPESNYILRGDSFRARVLLAAYDGSNPPKIYVDNNMMKNADDTLDYKPAGDGTDLIGIENGLGSLKIGTNGLGLGDKNYKGTIVYEGPNGVEEHPFLIPPFTVAEPALVVSPTKMNVLYRGVPNPVEISVPGAVSVSPSCPGHNISPSSDGGYIVKPGAGNKAMISVTATMPDGSTSNMPAKEFRVKNIPNPVPVFGGKGPTDAIIPKNTLAAQVGVVARMENFDFEVNVSVASFKMVFMVNGQPVPEAANGNKLTGGMKEKLKKVRRGESIWIEDIMVKMPDGRRVKVNNLSFRVV